MIRENQKYCYSFWGLDDVGAFYEPVISVFRVHSVLGNAQMLKIRDFQS